MSDGSDSDGDYYSANFKRFKEKRQKNALNNSRTSSQVQSIPIVTVEKHKVESKKRKKDVRKCDLPSISNEADDEPSVCGPEIDPEIEALFDSPAITLKSPPRNAKPETDRIPIFEDIVVLDTNEDASCLSIQSDILTDSSVVLPSCWIHFKNIFTSDKIVIMCEMDRTFSSIIEENASRIGVDPDKILLMGADRRFYPNESPQSVGFLPDTVNSLDICEDGSATGEIITIKWQLKGKKPIQANILIKQKFSVLKANLCKEQNLDPNKTRLVFDSEKHDENSCAHDEGIESDVQMRTVYRTGCCLFEKQYQKLYLLHCKRLYGSGSDGSDHYKTLAVERSASAKEIKTAFYKLSKIHHPDANPKDPEKSAQSFQKVVSAYEILGNADKKRDYDMQFQRGRARSTIVLNQHGRPASASRNRSYTDLDLDYKDFEHFVRSTRKRRRILYNEFEMPEYFKNIHETHDPRTSRGPTYMNYKDSRAFQREEEEKRLMRELEELKKKDRFTMPSFDELIRKEQRRRRERIKALTMCGLSLAAFSLIISLFSRT